MLAPTDHQWRSLEDYENPAALREWLEREFPAGAAAWPADMSRRRFIELMGASLALAGATGCGRAPREHIVPYVTPPVDATLGRPVYFASAMPWEGFGRGILAESHLGRPTKIEGNPDHPESLGATDPVTQAAVLSLYDPDRSRTPLFDGAPRSWITFDEAWLELRAQLAAQNGAGLAVLTEPTTSPTLRRTIHQLLDAFPAARWFQHTAIEQYDFAGVQADLDVAAADVIVSCGADFLYHHPASLRYARGFMRRRRVAANEQPINRLYVFEPTVTVTGSMADHRLPVSPARMTRILRAIAVALGVATDGAGQLTADEQRIVNFAARDLRTSAPNVAVIVGAEMNAAAHQLAAQINAQLGAVGAAIRYLPAVRSDADQRAAGKLADLAHTIEAGEVRALFILSANPAYTASADIPFGELLARVPFTAHLGLHRDETAARCRWHLPETYFLETWFDLRGYNGAATIIQPLIEPLYNTRSAHELLRFLASPPGSADYDLVRETWREELSAERVAAEWDNWLRTGVVSGTEIAAVEAPAALMHADQLSPSENEIADDAIVLAFRADPHVGDGRWANNAWLQELPKPFTHLVWDNALLVSPALARERGLATNDVVRVEVGGRSLECAVWVQPGQAERCVELYLGFGHTRLGSIAKGRGFNAYALRPGEQPWHAPVAALTRTGRTYPLASTQHHFRMEGRDLVRVVEAGALAQAHLEEHAHPTLFPVWESVGHAWAMAIDLSTCIGCTACVVACQAENNIPVVGKEQVARGREMHWIRVDRYYAGEPANPRMLHQPVPCMHCETAPCELVCPVAATVHSSEGLNEMIYNRCIGTRYCSNNCPYKVRRFNFFDFQPPEESPVTLQKNPDVTVRARGVMEKCTYCVQRIERARIEASTQSRAIRDGEIQPACAQACPTEAIVFGDLALERSRVRELKEHPLNYALLAELNTKPRTTYLARVVNSAEEAEVANQWRADLRVRRRADGAAPSTQASRP